MDRVKYGLASLPVHTMSLNLSIDMALKRAPRTNSSCPSSTETEYRSNGERTNSELELELDALALISPAKEAGLKMAES